MLLENHIVESVSQYLKNNGFELKQQLLSTEKGDDIIAVHNKTKTNIFIEAKGETSAVVTSKRYGKPFSKSQVKDHVANAFYRAAKMLDENGDSCLVGIALPQNSDHQDVVHAIQKSLKKMKIEVFWVNSNREVVVANHWNIWT